MVGNDPGEKNSDFTIVKEGSLSAHDGSVGHSKPFLNHLLKPCSEIVP